MPDLSASGENRDLLDEHSRQDPSSPASGRGAIIGWAVALVVGAIALIVAAWQVNEQVYTPQTTAEHYWEALRSGNGAEAIGLFEAVPNFTQDESIDNLLLDGEPLAHSTGLTEAAQLEETEDGAQLSLATEADDYTTEIPMTRAEPIWGFFDDWRLAANAITWFEVEVPGAPQGGIGQVQVNGEPVNLDEETARLSAFIPTVTEISIDSQWLTGSTGHVVLAPEDPEAPAQRVTMELEASEEAAQLMHEEIAEFFDSCAEQQVLMPAGCPVGTTTTHQVDAGTIQWSFPDPEEFQLTFDAEGWHVTYDQLAAEVSYQARHYHTGEQLTETEDVPFDLDVQVGASGEDLIISVTGAESGD